MSSIRLPHTLNAILTKRWTIEKLRYPWRKPSPNYLSTRKRLQKRQNKALELTLRRPDHAVPDRHHNLATHAVVNIASDTHRTHQSEIKILTLTTRCNDRLENHIGGAAFAWFRKPLAFPAFNLLITPFLDGLVEDKQHHTGKTDEGAEAS